MPSITRFRGDTIPDRIRVKDVDGNAVNVTGCTFVLTISRQRNPTDTLQQLAAVTGTIVSAVLGTVDFVFSGPQADLDAGNYFFDIKMINTLAQVNTILTGGYTVKQGVGQ